MNLVRGLRRVLVVATVVYWCGAAVMAHDAYASKLRHIADMTDGYNQGLLSQEKVPLYEEALRRGLIGSPHADRRVALSDAARSLGRAAIAYAAIAAALAALLWIISGFKSPNAKSG